MDNQTHIELLEEYKALRAEILLQIDSLNKLQHIWFLFTSSLITVAITQEQPFICILAWIFNLYFWKKHLGIASAIAKIGAYIAVFIEPKTDALHWETIAAEIDKIAAKSRNKKRTKTYNYSKLVFPGVLIAIISSITGLILAYNSWFKQYSIYYIFLFIVLFAVGQIILFRKQWNYDGPNDKTHWQKLWKEELEKTKENA